MNIVFIGMRGSGKTAVGKILAQRLSRELVELDELVAQKAGMTIPEIVARQGWEKFRDIEEEVTAEATQRDNIIIATGGGVVTREPNITNLKENGMVVWLTAGIDTLLQRIGDDKNRPLLKGKTRRDQCPQPVWIAIQDYLCAADKLDTIQPENFIFTPLTDRATRLPNIDPESWNLDRPLSSREVGRLLKKYARRAGLDPTKIRVHSLRHTAAMLRKQAGDDIDQISSFLGHSNLSTTQIYLHRLEGQTDSSWMRVAALLGL